MNIIKRLVELANCQEDWDSYGGLPLNPLVIISALKLIGAANRLYLKSQIFLTTMGGLELYWRKGAREMTVTIEPDDPTSAGACAEDKATGKVWEPDERVPLAEVAANMKEWLDDRNP